MTPFLALRLFSLLTIIPPRNLIGTPNRLIGTKRFACGTVSAVERMDKDWACWAHRHRVRRALVHADAASVTQRLIYFRQLPILHTHHLSMVSISNSRAYVYDKSRTSRNIMLHGPRLSSILKAESLQIRGT